MSSMPRWSRLVAVTLVLVIVAASFGLSFTVLRDLAIAVGIPAEVGWLWPVVVDGTITAATLVLYVDRKKWLPLTTLVVFGAASVVGNVAHILMAQPDGASWGMPVFVGLIPPLGLLMAVELLSGLLKVEAPASAPEAVSPPAELVVAAVTGTTDTVISTDSVPDESDLGVEALQEAVTEGVASDDTVSDTETSIVEADIVTDAAPGAPQPEVVEDRTASVDDAPEASKPVEQTAPVRQLHAVEQVPETPGEQVAWILKKARAGEDVSSWKDLAKMFEEQLGLDLGTRTVQRRLAAAKEQDPEAFGLAS